MPENILRYFPSLSDHQIEKIAALKEIYEGWNSKINVISRKDMDDFYLHHVLYSLAVAKVFSFLQNTRVLDVGTGGGFPGIPLAIMFPDSEFILLDSIGKKIKVVNAVIKTLGLANARAIKKRVEEEKEQYDFITGRAVAEFPGFVSLVVKNISLSSKNRMKNGIIYLKGGNADHELGSLRDKVTVWNISDFFDEPFFDIKKIIYLPV